jgi:hypothetical protein
MSYNLDNFKVKELENFRIPVKNFTKKDFGKPKIDLETNEIEFESKMSEIGEIKGKLVDGFVEVKKINIYGDGSGYFMNTVGDELLKNSTGTLVATLVWEDGDSVERLTIIDGIEKREEL